jgi:hypothetical protein
VDQFGEGADAFQPATAAVLDEVPAGVHELGGTDGQVLQFLQSEEQPQLQGKGAVVSTMQFKFAEVLQFGDVLHDSRGQIPAGFQHQALQRAAVASQQLPQFADLILLQVNILEVDSHQPFLNGQEVGHNFLHFDLMAEGETLHRGLQGRVLFEQGEVVVGLQAEGADLLGGEIGG